MQIFLINVLIQLLVFFTCFEHHGVHHQEEHLYMQFFMVCFSYIYVSSLAGEICTRFVGLHYIIASQRTVQRHKVLYTSVYSDKIIRNTKIKVTGLY